MHAVEEGKALVKPLKNRSDADLIVKGHTASQIQTNSGAVIHQLTGHGSLRIGLMAGAGNWTVAAPWLDAWRERTKIPQPCSRDLF